MKKHLLCACLTGIGFLTASHAALAEPLADRLERPANQSPLADRKLFTDLAVADGNSIGVGAEGVVLTLPAEGGMHQGDVPVDLLLTAVDFANASLGWAVGHDGAILVTNDGGRRWQKQIDGTRIGELMLSAAEDAVRVLEDATAATPDDEDLALRLENALFRLDDIQASLEYGPALPLMDVEFVDDRTGFAVGAFGMALVTRDGGQSWQFIPGLENPDSFHLNAVISPAQGVVLIAGENGLLFRSSDNGQSWDAPQEVGTDSLYNFVAGPKGELLAMGFGGSLHLSQNHGVTWTPLDTGTSDTLFGGTALSNGGMLLAQRGGLLYTENFEQFRVWPAPGRSIWMDVVEPSAGQLILAGQAGIKTLSLEEIMGGLQ
ncbi:sialidase family protein [Marinobacter mobilis]|uniref:Photosynthesis system II assembly factor Ycf48/Hcf136-like domain-containing protein n=1 Tax=Marinobacter mobilis TaxID=488533 RepID=A0A1H2XXH8_9GAMM|nr:YCF48-related protein [Marinobacter mobilis]SDW97521.1 Uncharacterized protein SAMN04487960_105189 [Marinobacter mobilis]